MDFAPADKMEDVEYRFLGGRYGRKTCLSTGA